MSYRGFTFEEEFGGFRLAYAGRYYWFETFNEVLDFIDGLF